MQSKNCLKCDKPYTENDLIVLNANEDDLNSNHDKYNSRKETKLAIRCWRIYSCL